MKTEEALDETNLEKLLGKAKVNAEEAAKKKFKEMTEDKRMKEC